jgi:hypothetical protein
MSERARFVAASAAAAVLLASGCTHWNSRTQYGAQQETGRRLIGAPQVAETSSASLSAGFAGASGHDAGGSGILGGLSGSAGSTKRTHCVQQAEIDFVQPYEIVPVGSSRALDWVGTLVLGILGLGVVGQASASQDTFWEPGDPYYEEPPDPTAGYLVGGAMIAGAIGWIGYSYAKLPRHPAPAVQSSQRLWTETQFVEATGCGLVPADVVAPGAPASPGGDDTAARLEKLDRLRDSGVITEAEYQQKRKALIDAL